jgi:hypothetical protein
VAQLGQRPRPALPDHAPEALVGRHLPLHGEPAGRHAPAGLEQLRDQPRPEHDPGGGRVAAGHPELERVLAAGRSWLGLGPADGHLRQGSRSGDGRDPGEEAAAADGGLGGSLVRHHLPRCSSAR